MRTVIAFSTATPGAKSPLESSLPPTATTTGQQQQQRSPWHSPVPYLFGGLAGMLGLIAFALLILACSYWKLSSRLEDREGGERDLESGGGDEKGDGSNKSVKVFEEKVLVVMAGNENPTFLATPVSVCSKAASFGGADDHADEQGMSKKVNKEESSEKAKEEMGSHDPEEPEDIRNQDDESETQLRRLQEEQLQHENQRV
ncbi:protein GLUTAMINE DUMPER 3 [Pyrus x bretschneideri]|uniref:protein GLUTAMINE DUMPER 3 n=1 Tax=Pyrus x bretschneideri TaxID=225117 RepID=UPI000511152E|nr:protein GLUTAMINE DUMPER 3 [Pyrus x bretschneideri]